MGRAEVDEERPSIWKECIPYPACRDGSVANGPKTDSSSSLHDYSRGTMLLTISQNLPFIILGCALALCLVVVTVYMAFLFTHRQRMKGGEFPRVSRDLHPFAWKTKPDDSD